MKDPEESRREVVRQWIRHAEEDFLVAHELMERDRLSYNPVGFHAHRSEAGLVHDFRRCHDFLRLSLLGNGQSFGECSHLSLEGGDVAAMMSDKFPGDAGGRVDLRHQQQCR